jgi:hypothetical protein
MSVSNTSAICRVRSLSSPTSRLSNSVLTVEKAVVPARQVPPDPLSILFYCDRIIQITKLLLSESHEGTGADQMCAELADPGFSLCSTTCRLQSQEYSVVLHTAHCHARDVLLCNRQQHRCHNERHE